MWGTGMELNEYAGSVKAIEPPKDPKSILEGKKKKKKKKSKKSKK